MAKTPTEQAYSVPFINKTAIMMFLLPGIVLTRSDELDCAYKAFLGHSPYRSNSFQPLSRNPLECLDCLRSLLREAEWDCGYSTMGRGLSWAQPTADRGLLIQRE